MIKEEENLSDLSATSSSSSSDSSSERKPSEGNLSIRKKSWSAMDNQSNSSKKGSRKRMRLPSCNDQEEESTISELLAKGESVNLMKVKSHSGSAESQIMHEGEEGVTSLVRLGIAGERSISLSSSS